MWCRGFLTIQVKRLPFGQHQFCGKVRTRTLQKLSIGIVDWLNLTPYSLHHYLGWLIISTLTTYIPILWDFKSVEISKPPLRFQGLEARPNSCAFTPLDTFQSYLNLMSRALSNSIFIIHFLYYNIQHIYEKVKLYFHFFKLILT